ncbi:MAG: epimerase, partial [Deltaproteobacteria bacterium]|nr:epimerase [Deltaproteobacteria bacterium]
GLSYAIVRPTVLFGLEDVLINNIAWLLRRFPIFAIPGTGEYRLQPVHVADVALLAVQASEDKNNLTIDAVGPETYSFEALVKAVKKAIGSRTRLIRLAPSLCYAFTAAIDPFVRDIIVTRDEIKKLMLDNLVSYEPPMGKTRFSSWLMENADRIGRDYASELKRHFH